MGTISQNTRACESLVVILMHQLDHNTLLRGFFRSNQTNDRIFRIWGAVSRAMMSLLLHTNIKGMAVSLTALTPSDV